MYVPFPTKYDVKLSSQRVLGQLFGLKICENILEQKEKLHFFKKVEVLIETKTYMFYQRKRRNNDTYRFKNYTNKDPGLAKTRILGSVLQIKGDLKNAIE